MASTDGGTGAPRGSAPAHAPQPQPAVSSLWSRRFLPLPADRYHLLNERTNDTGFERNQQTDRDLSQSYMIQDRNVQNSDYSR